MYSLITTTTTLLLALLMRAYPALALTFATLSYDTSYGVGTNPLTTFACSDGVNGLEQKGYTTLNSLCNFPYIGGAPTVLDWMIPTVGNATCSPMAARQSVSLR